MCDACELAFMNLHASRLVVVPDASEMCAEKDSEKWPAVAMTQTKEYCDRLFYGVVQTGSDKELCISGGGT